MEHRPDGLIHLQYPFLSQWIINLILGIDKAISEPTPAVKPTLEKKLGGSTGEK